MCVSSRRRLFCICSASEKNLIAGWAEKCYTQWSMFINREISWLEFNQRVLAQAMRRELPLLERVKFLAITASNLDEFFQVRVGGLMLLQQSGKTHTDLTGLTAGEQLELIRLRAARMVADQYLLLNEELLPLLQQAGLAPMLPEELSEAQYSALEDHFLANVAPLLTPLAMEVEHPPVLPSLSIVVGVELLDAGTGETRFVAVVLPDCLPRLVHAASLEKDGYVLLEDLVAEFIGHLFPGEQIVRRSPLRVTRNGDIAVAEQEGSNFAREMEAVLVARKFSDCVRLELPASTDADFARRIAELVGADEFSTYRVPGPLRLVDFGRLAGEPGHEHLKVESWASAFPAGVDPDLTMFENIAEGDILIHNPFESYEPVVKFVEEAAQDPDVLAIKQVLYRTAKNSRFIAALCRAAEVGKQVTVLVELKARFDESHNMEQAERLQRAGVQVVYGVKGFKTHAKITLVVRREKGSLRRYCHFGTGNYNEDTARLYSDLSLLTCNEHLGADASQFFNSVTGLTKLRHFRRLHPSPAMMKEYLLELIEAEARRARRGERAEIRAKMNSLNDPEMMAALESASAAGVRIWLNIRGICCWVPGTPAGRANTRIVSIVDRYLEHARIFSFGNGGSPLVFIASADWMRRNLDRRVELMVPIENRALAARVSGILDACFRDNVQSCLIGEDGASVPVVAPPNQPPFAMQQYLHGLARQSARARERAGRRTLEPHRPK
ncbi:MAG: polyphosphate kinase 1 [Akkermansia sp.]|nr:polyphosphate kinase 1 [Akkermansia sp.]